MTRARALVELHALHGSAMEHGLAEALPHVYKPGLTPSLSLPVFVSPAGIELATCVAVCVRDASGAPCDGGLVGLLRGGGAVLLALVDRPRGINTASDPAWTAFGMTMSVGKLLVREGHSGPCREVPWSILDRRGDDTADDLDAEDAAAWRAFQSPADRQDDPGMMKTLVQIREEHGAKYTRRRLGTGMQGGAMYGYTITCACGWTRKVNMPKRASEAFWKAHTREVWKAQVDAPGAAGTQKDQLSRANQ